MYIHIIEGKKKPFSSAYAPFLLHFLRRNLGKRIWKIKHTCMGAHTHTYTNTYIKTQLQGFKQIVHFYYVCVLACLYVWHVHACASEARIGYQIA